MKDLDEKRLSELGVSESAQPSHAVASLLRHMDGEIVVPHRGASMTPALPEECEVAIVCGKNVNFDEEDVVSFAGAGGIVTHRLLYLGKSRRSVGYVITGGDASWLPDAPIQKTELVGIVTKFRQNGEWQTIKQVSGYRSTKWTIARMAALSLLRWTLEIDVRLSLRVFDVIRGFRDHRRNTNR